MQVIVEERRRTPVVGEYEVVVLGGGPAGIAAAVAAGRAGRATALVERYGFLGGAGTAAGLANFCGLHARVHGEHRQVVHGIANDILERLERMNALARPHEIFNGRIQAQAYDISAYKIVADELLLEAEVKLFFHALAAGATPDALLIETKSGRQAIAGRLFIDCSGDGDLAAWRGAPFEVGDGRGGMLYPSTMYRIGNVDFQKAGNAWEALPRLMEEAELAGKRFPRKKPIVRPQPNPSEWRANLTQIRNPDGTAVSGIDAEQLSYGEVEGRRQCRDTFEFIRGALPGFERAHISEIAPQIGIRETRRVLGEYVLSEDDVLDCKAFPDAIGVNGWPVEAHVAGDVQFVFQRTNLGYNQLPYRMIVPQKLDNVLVAGRCASMTHGGQSAARVSGPCFAMGQAAGTAAHLALDSGGPPRTLNTRALQKRLEMDGAFLGERGHIELKSVFWILLILGVIAAEQFTKLKTGSSLFSLVDPLWAAAGAAGAAVVALLVFALSYKRVRIEKVGERTVVHFDGRQYEVLPDPPQAHRWTSGGAFGQPMREFVTLKRGEEVLYEGPASDGERLLAALSQQPLAGGDAAKV
jgi:hypothetical protein